MRTIRPRITIIESIGTEPTEYLISLHHPTLCDSDATGMILPDAFFSIEDAKKAPIRELIEDYRERIESVIRDSRSGRMSDRELGTWADRYEALGIILEELDEMPIE